MRRTIQCACFISCLVLAACGDDAPPPAKPQAAGNEHPLATPTAEDRIQVGADAVGYDGAGTRAAVEQAERIRASQEAAQQAATRAASGQE
jgi:hypothetical protein